MGLLDDSIRMVEEQQEWSAQQVAAESVSAEKEKEYCLWVKPTDAGWAWLAEAAGEMRLDVLIPVPYGRCRARISQTPDGTKGELSNKYRAEEGSNEINSEVGVVQVLGFFSNTDYLSHVFKRISLAPNEEVKAKYGKGWDIDVFFAPPPARPELVVTEHVDEFLTSVAAGTNFAEWVKVELNVEKFLLPGIEDIVPFEYSEKIPSRTQDPVLQEVVRHFWEVETAI